MAPTYRLTYFNLRGLAEPIRLMLAYGDIDYEDIRIEREQWPEMKASTPFGKLPILEEDGVKITQSVTICRYLARKMNLTGKNDVDSRRCDEIVDTIGDIRSSVSLLRQETDEAKKEEKMQTLKNETLPFYCSKFDDILKNNKGWFVGSGITWTDIYMAYMLSLLSIFVGTEILEKYPNLKEHSEKVFNIPTIKAWIDKRPVTEM